MYKPKNDKEITYRGRVVGKNGTEPKDLIEKEELEYLVTMGEWVKCGATKAAEPKTEPKIEKVQEVKPEPVVEETKPVVEKVVKIEPKEKPAVSKKKK